VKKKSTEKTNTKPSTKNKKGPRQKQLPGMEDKKIAALQDAALSYAEARDARIAATGDEVSAKKHLLSVMHANKKKRYVHGDVYVEIIPEGEKLKVKILEDGEEAPTPKQDVEKEEDDVEKEDVSVSVTPAEQVPF